MIDYRAQLCREILKEVDLCRKEGRPNHETIEQIGLVIENHCNGMPHATMLQLLGIVKPARWVRGLIDTRPGKWIDRLLKADGGDERTR